MDSLTVSMNSVLSSKYYGRGRSSGRTDRYCPTCEPVVALRTQLALMGGRQEEVRLLDALMSEFNALRGVPTPVEPDLADYVHVARFLAAHAELRTRLQGGSRIRAVELEQRQSPGMRSGPYRGDAR